MSPRFMEVFRENEFVHVLDPATSVWEKAKIVAFVNEWAAKVTWTGWAYTTTVVEVPAYLRDDMAHWNFRKPQTAPEPASGSKRRRTTISGPTLTYDPKRLCKDEQVYFLDYDLSDSAAIPEMLNGTVRVNDPFLRQLSVLVEDDVVNVPYFQLRNDPETDEETDSTDEESTATLSQVSAARPILPKNKIDQRPEIEVLELLKLEFEAETVALTYVPCVNGVLKRGSIAAYASRKYRVDTLVFDGRRGKALASLTCLEDEDVTVTMPAVKVRLAVEDYMKGETSSSYSEMEKVDQAFAIFAAVKRAVGFSRKKLSHTMAVVPDSPMARRLTGFSTKYSAGIDEGKLGCNHSWDAVLGERWDVLSSAKGQADCLDTVIKSMRFSVQEDLLMHTIRVHIGTVTGRYATDSNYRATVAHNKEEASKAYYR